MPATLLDRPAAVASAAGAVPAAVDEITQDEALARLARVPGYLLRVPCSTWWLVVGWIEITGPAGVRPVTLQSPARAAPAP